MKALMTKEESNAITTEVVHVDTKTEKGLRKSLDIVSGEYFDLGLRETSNRELGEGREPTRGPVK